MSNTNNTPTSSPATIKKIVWALNWRFEQNEENVQEKAKESPEFYRCIMYTLYAPAKRIDGTDEYHAIVDALEELMNTK